MDVANSFSTLNWVAVIVATIAAFILGGVWYGPLFSKAWMKGNGFTSEDLEERNMPKVFGLSFILTFVAALNLALFLGPSTGAAASGIAGFFAGCGWVAMFLGVIYLFEKKSLELFLINAGYCTLALTAMGLILGAWR